MTVSRKIKQQMAQARYLIVMKDFTQREASKIVGVSEPTISSWVNKYEWNDRQTKEVKQKGGVRFYVNDFFEFVLIEAPDLLKSFRKLWCKYLRRHQNNINI